MAKIGQEWNGTESAIERHAAIEIKLGRVHMHAGHRSKAAIEFCRAKVRIP